MNLSACTSKLSLIVALASLSASAHAAGLAATATYTDVQVSPGVYNYSMVLSDTGTTAIGTFWFAWVPGAGFLSPIPTSISSPTGWKEVSTDAGAALQWTTTTNPLAPGQSLAGFNFVSAETPDQMLLNYIGGGVGNGDPVTTSFVYIGAPFRDPGLQFVVAATPTPEPGTMMLTLTGLGMGAASLKSRLRRG